MDEVLKRGQTPLGLLSIDTQTLYNRLTEAAVGDLVTYHDLGLLISRNVQTEARGLLETARDKALREDSMLFGVVLNIGLKRLNDVEAVATGRDSIDRIRRASKRAIRKMGIVEYQSLPEPVKVQHNAHLAALGVVEHFTSEKQLRRIEGISVQSQPDMHRLLEEFRGS